MSTELNQLGLDGEQQLGINLGSSEGRQQMGINPCPLSSPTTKNGGQQRASTQVHRMEDNKWELTHVHIQWGTTNGNQPTSTKLILLRVCGHKTNGQKMGQD